MASQPAHARDDSSPLGDKDLTLELEILDLVLARSSTHPMDWLSELACTEAVRLLARARELETAATELGTALEQRLFEAIPGLDKASRSDALKLRRTIRAGKKERSEAPSELLAALGAEVSSLYARWTQGERQAEAGAAEARAALQSSLTSSRARLRERFADPLFREGVLLSSGSLHAAIERYVHEDRKLERSTVSHLARACAKTTPRGLLTGVAVVEWEGSPTGAGRASRPYRRRTIFPLHLMRKLCERVSDQDGLWNHVRPRPSAAPWAGPSAEASEAGTVLLELAGERSLTAMELIDRAAGRLQGSRSRDEIASAYRELCRDGFLVGCLEIPFGVRDGLSFLSDWLREASERDGDSEAPALLAKVRSVQRGLAGLDAGSRDYGAVRASLAELLPNVAALPVEDLFVVECAPSPVGRGLSPAHRAELDAAVRACVFMSAARQARLVPEAVARDFLIEVGLVRPDEVEARFPLSELMREGLVAPPHVTSWRSGLGSAEYDSIFNAWLDQQGGGRVASSLDIERDGLLERLRPSGKAGLEVAAGHSAVEFQIARGRSPAEDLVVLEHFVPSLTAPVARFTEFLGSEEMRAQLRAHGRWLATHVDPQRIWADLLFLSGRADTVLSHDLCHEHCVELFDARSGEDVRKVIPLSELWVRVSGGLADLVWCSDRGEVGVH
ncbi:MAG TPA: lantibiotic dehydratase, partial [Bdellovibrionota bacterium]|nr:lantibiotic dehydratase [Bdellovibrionota bacterium]